MRRDRTGEPIDEDDEDQDQTTTDIDAELPAMTADQAKAHIRRILNTDQRSGAT